MLLDNKSAVIYGGGGSIGGAVARAFAREGSRVFLAGRTRATLEEVAEAIRATGGAAEIRPTRARELASCATRAAAALSPQRQSRPDCPHCQSRRSSGGDVRLVRLVLGPTAG